MTRKITRTPPANDAAQAFEDLRKEISLQRSAIEGLTAAKDKIPEHSQTLRDTAQRLDQVESIDQRPAMQPTPLTLAAESFEASRSFGAEDRKSVGEAREALARELDRVEGMIKQKRSTEEPDWWVTWAATGGLLIGAFPMLIGVALAR